MTRKTAPERAYEKYSAEHYGHEGHVRGMADFYDINNLNNLCFTQPPMPWRYFVDIFLRNPMLIFVVVREKETRNIVGKWSCYVLPRDHGGSDAVIGWTEQVAVHPAHQGCGIGRLLYKKMVSVARQRGIVHDNLSSSKPGAQRFYLRLGYKKRQSQLFRRPLDEGAAP